MAGKLDKAKGRAKEAIGHAVGNPKLEREGKRDQAVGEVKDKVHQVKKQVEHEVDKTLHPEDDEDEERP
jgi:uncharacterized protein YjbJ (UPF0337 family)